MSCSLFEWKQQRIQDYCDKPRQNQQWNTHFEEVHQAVLSGTYD